MSFVVKHQARNWINSLWQASINTHVLLRIQFLQYSAEWKDNTVNIIDICSSFLIKMFHLQIELPHIKQRTDWDCGLACCLMVLQKIFGNKFDSAKYEKICATRNFGTSVWTIDIASIFTEFKLDYVFYTLTLGVDPSYEGNSFYKRTFNVDEMRVNSLFTVAPYLGLKVEKR